MSLYIPERAKPIRTGSLFVLMAVNIGFAACVLWGWAVLHMGLIVIGYHALALSCFPLTASSNASPALAPPS